MKITAQDKIAVILNIIPPEAEKQMFGFEISDLEDSINLSMKPLPTTGQRQFGLIQSQKFQPLCIIEIRKSIQRFLFGIV